jgi:predicted DNA-binding transcriptional regulator AlpA
MFGTIIRMLLDDKLTTINEIEEVTGRASSTIYRWMNGESEPHATDVRLLVRHMKSEQARRKLISVLASDLPVVISWVEDVEHEAQEDESADRLEGTEVLDRSLLALDCLSHALSEGNDAIRKQELSRESYVKLVTLVDETIRHLTASRTLLKRYAPEGWIPEGASGGQSAAPGSG